MRDIVSELRGLRDFEALILYGSQADGRAKYHSDYDFLGLVNSGAAEHFELEVSGVWVSCRTVNKAIVNTPCTHPTLGCCIKGVPVYDPRGIGARFVDCVTKVARARQNPLSSHSLEVVYACIASDFAGSFQDNPYSWFLRQRFLRNSLKALFLLNGSMYMGRKKALATLKRDAPLAYGLYGKALDSSACDADIAAWFNVLTCGSVAMDSFDFDFAGTRRDSLVLAQDRNAYAQSWWSVQDQPKTSLEQALKCATEHLKEIYPVHALGICNPLESGCVPYLGYTLSLCCVVEGPVLSDQYKDVAQLVGKPLFPAGRHGGLSYGGFPATVNVWASEAFERVSLSPDFDQLLSARLVYEDEPGAFSRLQTKVQQDSSFILRTTQRSPMALQKWLSKDLTLLGKASDKVVRDYHNSVALLNSFYDMRAHAAGIRLDEQAFLNLFELSDAEGFALFCRAIAPGAHADDIKAWFSYATQASFIFDVSPWTDEGEVS